MKSLHLKLALLCHVLLVSLVLYFTSQAAGSPLEAGHKQPQVAADGKLPQPLGAPTHFAAKVESVQHKPKVQVVAEAKAEPRSAAPAAPIAPVAVEKPKPVAAAQIVEAAISPVHHVEASKPVAQPELVGRSAEAALVVADEQAKQKSPSVVVVEYAIKPEEVQVKAADLDMDKSLEAKKVSTYKVVEPMKAAADSMLVKPAAKLPELVKSPPEVAAPIEAVKPTVAEVVPVPQSLVIEHRQPVTRVESPVQEVAKAQSEIVAPKQIVGAAPAPVEPAVAPAAAAAAKEDKKSVVVVEAQQAPAAALEPVSRSKPAAATPVPIVMGGLGPLHLLATTLCSYQPDKPVADEHLNQLYARRASVRKSLFEFMSLKFTNLEKLSSRLGHGLQVVPVASDANKMAGSTATAIPSHGWPVVGKCTAHDLKLMGEASWCECQEGDQSCAKQPAAGAASAAPVDPMAAKDEPEQPMQKVESVVAAAAAAAEGPAASRLSGARSIVSDSKLSFLPSPDESSVISKLLHVSDIKDAPTVESSIYNLNLTQHQLATLEAHATSTQECRRNSLRYTKALFNHLAENQHEQSNSWPQLYALISADDCARKRMIDIVNALSGFRTDTTSIRRDNLEFAFAMDDLRAKVLESEVNIPLTFDRHFIEVEQFLQQSVRLMLANVQPKRAKLTSLRYRSLMYGASQQAFDDQCIDLHQRLLAKNYPNDCNPTQFGQLPDVLRMTASSLELWSIEKELSLRTARVADYPNSTAVGQQKVKEDVNECIANLVSS